MHMDIMMPRLEHQPSPAPWLFRHSRINMPRLIATAMEQNPDASVDQVVTQLAAWNVQASGIIVAMWLAQWKTSSAEAMQNGGDRKTVNKNQSPSGQTGEPQWASTI
jgi:hypothetical protein